MFSLRVHLIICGALFATIVLFAVAGSALETSGARSNPAAFRIPALVVFIGLVIAFAFSAVPAMIKLVLGFQAKLGNQNVAPVRAAIANQNRIVWIMWALMAAGAAIALPAAFVGGAFGDDISGWAASSFAGKSQGVLVAAPGMSLDELVRASTLKLGLEGRKPPIYVVAAEAVFDFQVPGSSFRFEHCRYYFMSTFTHDRQRVQGMSIGTSPRKVTRAGLDAADAAVRQHLVEDGWLAGHEVYRTPQDQQLHGGATKGPAGRTWLKNEVVLNIQGRRMDDVVVGQDSATSGEWIQFIELWGRTDYPGIERLVFEPWQGQRQD